MQRNGIWLIAAALGVAAVAVGYWIYTDQQRSGVEVNVGGRTLSIETR